jgi:PilZ domain
MSLRAPLRVPVELKRSNRWFRLAREVSLEGISLSHAVPDEVEGPLEVRFHLPEAAAVACHGEVVEELVGEGDEERAERRLVRFLDLDEDGAARIQAYVQERLGII